MTNWDLASQSARTWGWIVRKVVTVPGVISVGLGLRSVAVGSATAGVAIAWLLAPIQQYSFDELPGRRLPYVPDAWFGAYEAVYERFGPSLGLSQYYFFGRFAFLIYVCGLLSVLALPHGQSRLTRVGRRLLLGAFGLGLLGDVLAYWGGTGEELTTLTSVGFGLIEIPAMLLMVAAAVCYGLGLLRDRVLPRWSAWSLCAAGSWHCQVPWSSSPTCRTDSSSPCWPRSPWPWSDTPSRTDAPSPEMSKTVTTRCVSVGRRA